MSISKNITFVTGAALASTASAGVLTAAISTPTMSIVAHADSTNALGANSGETHDQNVSTNPSAGDNSVNDPTKVSTIDDAYTDVQGDTQRDTNQSQHSSIGWEYQDPDEAAASWGTPDDTKVEPGTDNTQTDWNIATNTNGKSATDTSYDVTGDSSENKFNPGNIYGTGALPDKTSSVRENWPAIEKANMSYDDFISQYGSYWGPVYWGWYSQGVGPYAYGYETYPVANGVDSAIVVSNNNNNNNNNNNSSVLNNTSGMADIANKTSTGNNGFNGQQGQNRSSSSSNSQTTILPNSTVVNGLVAGSGIVSNNNNNNNNNTAAINNVAASSVANGNPSYTVKTSDEKKDSDNNVAVSPKDTATIDKKTAHTPTTASTAEQGIKNTSVDNDNPLDRGVDNGAEKNTSFDTEGKAVESSDLPQTGNTHIEKSSIIGANAVLATLGAMGLRSVVRL